MPKQIKTVVRPKSNVKKKTMMESMCFLIFVKLDLFYSFGLMKNQQQQQQNDSDPKCYYVSGEKLYPNRI